MKPDWISVCDRMPPVDPDTKHLVQTEEGYHWLLPRTQRNSDQTAWWDDMHDSGFTGGPLVAQNRRAREMQLQGATKLELEIHETILRAETELPASELATTIVVALSDAVNELQRLREHIRVASNALDGLVESIEAVQDWPKETCVGTALDKADVALMLCEE